MTPGMPTMPDRRAARWRAGPERSSRPCFALRITAGRGVDRVRVTAETVVRRAGRRPVARNGTVFPAMASPSG